MPKNLGNGPDTPTDVQEVRDATIVAGVLVCQTSGDGEIRPRLESSPSLGLGLGTGSRSRLLARHPLRRSHLTLLSMLSSNTYGILGHHCGDGEIRTHERFYPLPR
jgi:hypothetical protein